MTKIIAHRGARSIAPENTIAAAEIARLIGADLWECDVSVTKDGHLILFHDDNLLRTTDVVKKFPLHKSFQVADFDLAQIKTLNTGTVFIKNDPFGEIAAGNISDEYLESFKDEKIPTLEDALNYTKKTGWTINLELKSQIGTPPNFSIPKMVVELIIKLKVDPMLIIISSFNHRWLNDVKNLFPDIEVQHLFGDDIEDKKNNIDWQHLAFNLDFLDSYDFGTYNINSSIITIDEIKFLKMQGKKVNLFTVNDKNSMQHYIDSGVDGIFTDYPQIMVTLR
ncbi:MAG: hypothetical protein HQK68_03255 [Desulfamplus sp.]|nr:hypothetical protein [Desulfamplus sp.]